MLNHAGSTSSHSIFISSVHIHVNLSLYDLGQSGADAGLLNCTDFSSDEIRELVLYFSAHHHLVGPHLDHPSLSRNIANIQSPGFTNDSSSVVFGDLAGVRDARRYHSSSNSWQLGVQHGVSGNGQTSIMAAGLDENPWSTAHIWIQLRADPSKGETDGVEMMMLNREIWHLSWMGNQFPRQRHCCEETHIIWKHIPDPYCTMPRQSTLTEICVNNIIECLTPALTLLIELNDAFGLPFIQSIGNAVESMIGMAQLMENIHPVLYAIINLYLKSGTVESLDPGVLHNIGRTRPKIYTFFKAQPDETKLKHLFRNHEMQNLLEGCHAGLDQAVKVFKITTRPAMISEINAIKKTTQLMHEELLELIQTQCDPVHPQLSVRQVYLGSNGSKNSSTSFSMLPSEPKIFQGCESKVENIMKMLTLESPRIAILGGGGMGKTSLARAVHHPDTSAKFEDRLFVIAESATTSIELAALIGLHVGLNPGPISYNLWFLWEPIQSRGGIEEFLAILTAVEHLALIPLSVKAAQQIFIEITDNVYGKEETVQILQFTDNMPLAVDLIAHLSDYEMSWLDGTLKRQHCYCKLPIPNILSCKAVLLATSLAYQDSNWRLRSLMPVQEHVQQFLPPSTALVQCIHKLFYALLALYKKYNGEQLGSVMNQITQNLANFQEVLILYDYYPTFDREQIITQGMSILELVDSPLLESKFYNALGLYFINSKFDRPQALQFYHRAFELEKMCLDSNPRSSALWIEAVCLGSLGDFRQITDQLQRSSAMLVICSLANGELDHEIAIGLGEIHLQKSEYAEATKIYHHVNAICCEALGAGACREGAARDAAPSGFPPPGTDAGVHTQPCASSGTVALE
ncbi:hypothetical protein DFH08DRAFT_823428 [Mycena albidolilacea]|uniref:NB-ARC domain-containing protein n=1 Tax=Mycena albidolilacea TaxID=1033008 RepID=A0AAD6Z684_9AGAR|nr:hypothetical protein DFH08DRAFT_823428 [Mycena albidolilacea]